jgi:hypothetical protein
LEEIPVSFKVQFNPMKTFAGLSNLMRLSLQLVLIGQVGQVQKAYGFFLNPEYLFHGYFPEFSGQSFNSAWL